MHNIHLIKFATGSIKSALTALSMGSMLTWAVLNPAFATPAHGNNSHAQHEQGMRHEMHHKMFKRMAHLLSLTEQQRKQAQQIHQAGKQQAESFKAMLKSYHEEMTVLLAAEQFDEQAVLNLRAKYQDTFAQLALLKAKQKFEFLQILTAEQNIKWQEWQAKRADHEPNQP